MPCQNTASAVATRARSSASSRAGSRAERISRCRARAPARRVLYAHTAVVSSATPDPPSMRVIVWLQKADPAAFAASLRTGIIAAAGVPGAGLLRGDRPHIRLFRPGTQTEHRQGEEEKSAGHAAVGLEDRRYGVHNGEDEHREEPDVFTPPAVPDLPVQAQPGRHGEDPGPYVDL